jgi:tetratricopeptide (TPR) repeat protein
MSLCLGTGCEDRPSQTSSPRLAPVTEPTPEPVTQTNEDVFLKGTPEQREHLVTMRTMMLNGGEDAEAVKVLSRLFYSQPTSLLQLGSGIELARQLHALDAREAAVNVLDELEAAELEPAYGKLLWLQSARLRAEMAQPEQARVMYARVLEHAPDYEFIYGELAALDGDLEAQQRYETWRATQIMALFGESKSARAAAFKLLDMMTHDPQIERAMQDVLKVSKFSKATHTSAAAWLQKHQPPKQAAQQGEPIPEEARDDDPQ